MAILNRATLPLDTDWEIILQVIGQRSNHSRTFVTWVRHKANGTLENGNYFPVDEQDSDNPDERETLALLVAVADFRDRCKLANATPEC